MQPQYSSAWLDAESKSPALYIAVNVEDFPFRVAGGIVLDRETKPWGQRSGSAAWRTEGGIRVYRFAPISEASGACRARD